MLLSLLNFLAEPYFIGDALLNKIPPFLCSLAGNFDFFFFFSFVRDLESAIDYFDFLLTDCRVPSSLAVTVATDYSTVT